MPGPFIHQIDPVIGEVAGIYLWWYGLSYTLGFTGVFFWLRRNRAAVGFSHRQVYDLTLFIAAGVLAGGRLVEVFFYEWAYYGAHPWHIPAIWLGGMSTHGILLGAILAIFIFSRLRRFHFIDITDLLAVAAAYIMGLGRLGNFIDGQIVGSLTDGWWGVQFPDAEGYRHAVVLYDGIKNLLLIPLLLLIRRTCPPRGVLTAHFLLWYGCLRIFVDVFREYRSELFGLPPGQLFNLSMTVAGLALLLWFRRRNESRPEPPPPARRNIGDRLAGRRIALAILLLVPLVIPSDWTQDVPGRYGSRHPGMAHSAIYPVVGD
jgi:phosphatidylglycerol:prolipoprotein diacylglycerol transferase